jgi:S-(hydroxymethyl)glutathione dehydrogenase/alcohol dehydrogenase
MTDKNGTMLHHGAMVSGFAEYIVVPEDGAIKVREDLPLDQTCLMGCSVPTGVGAVWNAAKVKPNEAVAIWGLGGVGLNVLRGAALVQANPIVAIDLNGAKKDMAMEWGATHFIDNSKVDPIPVIQELTGGVGVDFAFEVIGDHGAIVQAWWAVKPAGSLIQVGITPQNQATPLPLTFMPMQMKKIIGAMYGHVSPKFDIPKLCDMAMTGVLKLDKLITQRARLEDINSLIDDMIQRRIMGRAIIEFI